MSSHFNSQPAVPARPLRPNQRRATSEIEYTTLNDDTPTSPFDDPTGFGGTDWGVVDERRTGVERTKSLGSTRRSYHPPSSYSPTYDSDPPSPTDYSTSPQSRATSLASFTKSFKDKAASTAKSAAKNTADWHARASQPGGVLARAKEMGAEFGAKAIVTASEAATAAKEAAVAVKAGGYGEKVATYWNTRDGTAPVVKSLPETKPTNPVFGACVVDAVDRSKVEMVGQSGYGIDIDDVPAVVFRSIEFMDVYGLEEVGIYRLSGSSIEVASLKKLFNWGADLDLTTVQIDPHAVASMFKSWLRELPEPILTYQLGQQFSDAAAAHSFHPVDDEGRVATPDPELISKIASLCKQLPREIYSVLALLCAHLYRVQARQKINKMGLTNLQVIFSPTLSMSSSLLGLFILYHEQVLPVPIPSCVKKGQRTPAPSTTPSQTTEKPSPAPPPPALRPRPKSTAASLEYERGATPSPPSNIAHGAAKFGGSVGSVSSSHKIPPYTPQLPDPQPANPPPLQQQQRKPAPPPPARRSPDSVPSPQQPLPQQQRKPAVPPPPRTTTLNEPTKSPDSYHSSFGGVNGGSIAAGGFDASNPFEDTPEQLEFHKGGKAFGNGSKSNGSGSNSSSAFSSPHNPFTLNPSAHTTNAPQTQTKRAPPPPPPVRAKGETVAAAVQGGGRVVGSRPAPPPPPGGRGRVVGSGGGEGRGGLGRAKSERVLTVDEMLS